MLSPLIMFLPIIVLFYLMIIRPQQRQEKQRRAMIASLQKNDKVLTSAGIYGTVVSLDGEGDRMTLRVSDGVKLEMTRSSVIRVERDTKAVEASKPA